MRNKIKNLITKKNSIDRQEFNVKTRNTRVITTFLEKKKKKEVFTRGNLNDRSASRHQTHGRERKRYRIPTDSGN